jgi:curved DNA-binding protein CbpA
MRSEQPDHYATLGLPTTASPGQITHAYRALVRTLHPDTATVPGTTTRRAPDAHHRPGHRPASTGP